MPDEKSEEWKRLIERYQKEMMAYIPVSANTQAISSTPESPSNEKETVKEPNPEENGNVIDIGQLQVRVSTENQAVPIPGAVITVTKEQENTPSTLIRTMIADDNGLTPIIDLETKDRRLSLVPGNPEPYAVYTVNVTADGYFPKRFTNVPIYGGVVAIQNVSMLPLPEFGDNDMALTYPQNGPSL